MEHIPRIVEHVKAEAFLTSFLTSCSDVLVEPQGVFSRNYNDDIISFEVSDEIKNKYTLRLSRDSVFHILPEGLFFVENKLRELAKKNDTDKFKQEEERITREKKRICLFFQPFDTVYFRLRFELEQKLNDLTKNRIRVLIDKLFDVFPLQTDNRLIRKIIPLIPFASEIRGNTRLMKDVLKAVFYPTTMIDIFLIKKRKVTGVMGNVLSIIVHIEKLSATQFMNLQMEANVFAPFFYEWFIPVDLDYQLKIKDTREPFVLGKAMTLDYNTYL